MKKRLHNFSKIAEVKGNTDLALKELSVFVQLHAEMKELSHFCVSISSILYLIFFKPILFSMHFITRVYGNFTDVYQAIITVVVIWCLLTMSVSLTQLDIIVQYSIACF